MNKYKAIHILKESGFKLIKNANQFISEGSDSEDQEYTSWLEAVLEKNGYTLEDVKPFGFRKSLSHANYPFYLPYKDDPLSPERKRDTLYFIECLDELKRRLPKQQGIKAYLDKYGQYDAIGFFEVEDLVEFVTGFKRNPNRGSKSWLSKTHKGDTSALSDEDFYEAMIQSYRRDPAYLKYKWYRKSLDKTAERVRKYLSISK